MSDEQPNSEGASASADRAAGLRLQPPTASSLSSIPCAVTLRNAGEELREVLEREYGSRMRAAGFTPIGEKMWAHFMPQLVDNAKLAEARTTHAVAGVVRDYFEARLPAIAMEARRAETPESGSARSATARAESIAQGGSNDI